MRKHGCSAQRRLELLAAVLLAGIFGILPNFTGAQRTAIEIYRSPEFGYLLWWDPREWATEDHQVSTGADRLRLTNGTASIDVTGYAEAGASPESCIAARLELFANEPNLARFEALDAPGSAPRIDVAAPGIRASTEFVVAIESSAGRETFASRQICTALVPGAQMLLTSELISAENFNATANDGQDRFGADSLLSTLTMPRSTWTFDSGGGEPSGPWGFVRPDRVVDHLGGELGTLIAHLPDCDRHHYGYPRIIVAEGTGFGNFVVAPSAFVAVADGVEVQPDLVRWITPAIDASQSAVLRQHEFALLELAYPIDATELYYIDSSGNAMLLGDLLGCQGGGAAPVLIDLE